jgi:hypothetical protein
MISKSKVHLSQEALLGMNNDQRVLKHLIFQALDNTTSKILFLMLQALDSVHQKGVTIKVNTSKDHALEITIKMR